MPSETTTPKKIARRQVKRVNGQLVVVFIDVATGQVITDLTGYTIEPDTSQGTGGTNSPTPTPTPTDDDDKEDRKSRRKSRPFEGNGLMNPSVGSGDIVGDFGKTFGPLVTGAVNFIDMIGGATDGKEDTPTTGAGAGFAAPNYTAASKASVDKVSSTMQPTGGFVGPKDMGLTPANELQVGKNGWTTETASTNLPPEQRAFLDMLAVGDGNGTNYWESDGYNRIVGKGGTFDNFAQHPNKVGIRTSLGPSTAAGRYQFTATTWNDVVGQYNRQYPDQPITDFSPESQDQAALYLAQRDYARRTGRDLMADLANPPAEIGQLIKVGLGGSGRDTTWQILQKKSAGEISNAFFGQYQKNVQLDQQAQQAASQNSPFYNPTGVRDPNNFGANLLDAQAKDAAQAALQAPGYIPPTLNDLMGKFNALPGVTPSPAATRGIEAPVETAAPVDTATPARPMFSGNPRNDNPGQINTAPGIVGRVGMPADARPSSVPAVPAETYEQWLDRVISNTSNPAYAKAQANAYLDTINESLGKPQFNTSYSGDLIATDKGHPNTKAWLDEGADFTTAAGYGGITYPVWAQYAPKVGATDFSLDNQKKVMLAVATDNYEAKTGRSLVDDLISGNRDAMASTLVNSSNIWKTLPGGPSAAGDIPTYVESMASRAETYMAPTNAFTGVTGDLATPYTFDTEGIAADMQSGFANQPSTVVNSSGQVMSKSAADAMRDVSGVNYSDSGFANRIQTTMNNTKKTGESTGISSGGRRTATSYTPPTNTATRSTTPTPVSTSKPATQTTAKPSTSLGSGIGGAMKPKTASPIQKVTTPTGSTITKAQADAFRM